jgi:hypothetical protein
MTYTGDTKVLPERSPAVQSAARTSIPAAPSGLTSAGAPSAADLHAPADPVQQQVQPGEGVIHPEPAAHQLGDPASVQH